MWQYMKEYWINYFAYSGRQEKNVIDAKDAKDAKHTR